MKYPSSASHQDGLLAGGNAVVWNSKYPVATKASAICYSISSLMAYIELENISSLEVCNEQLSGWTYAAAAAPETDVTTR